MGGMTFALSCTSPATHAVIQAKCVAAGGAGGGRSDTYVWV